MNYSFHVQQRETIPKFHFLLSSPSPVVAVATNKGKPLIFRGQRRRHLLVAGWRNRR
ncbi:hypothetical protein Lalb_Chr23g0274951 [Lupinus albus]|uniref:Uncharacterized protein n=1 Tax=Lupinus albus TaxID=3870 RepID=A0A6A4NLL7_LUPAL|nr:hypothetical protein Lalb_Chr23g0274951 [Lupinus albus]